jgi:hypothetical protein
MSTLGDKPVCTFTLWCQDVSRYCKDLMSLVSGKLGGDDCAAVFSSFNDNDRQSPSRKLSGCVMGSWMLLEESQGHNR